MTVEVTKLLSTVVVGPTSGATASKLVAYVVMYPGSEGGSPANHRAYTYAQRIRRQDT